jgi:hypothetical protein
MIQAAKLIRRVERGRNRPGMRSAKSRGRGESGLIEPAASITAPPRLAHGGADRGVAGCVAARERSLAHPAAVAKLKRSDFSKCSTLNAALSAAILHFIFAGEFSSGVKKAEKPKQDDDGKFRSARAVYLYP